MRMEAALVLELAVSMSSIRVAFPLFLMTAKQFCGTTSKTLARCQKFPTNFKQRQERLAETYSDILMKS